ncbi:MAG: peptidylprolyl isomerase [Sulfitobacter sp.]
MQKTRTFLASVAMATVLSLPVMAQDAPTIDTVVATVNGKDITVGHMIVARATLPEQYQQLPDDVLFTGILEQLVQQTALADTIKGELPARVVLSLENETRSLHAAEAVEQAMAQADTEDAIKVAYEEQYGSADPEIEYNASHILVETEEEANALVEELAAGADFAELAKEKSTGPSGPNGGSLGWFSSGMMVPSFEAATVELEDGEISAPIKTQFGWHVILLNEKRTKDAPPLEDVREELDIQIRQTIAQTTIEAVTEAAEVDTTASTTIDPSVIKNIEWLE